MLNKLRHLIPAGLVVLLLLASPAYGQEEETMDIDVEDAGTKSLGAETTDSGDLEGVEAVIDGEEVTYGGDVAGEAEGEKKKPVDKVPGDFAATIGGLKDGHK